MGVVTCEDGEEGRGEERVTLPEGEMEEEGKGRKEGGRQGSIICLPFLVGENCCLDHNYCETFPLTGPHPLYMDP